MNKQIELTKQVLEFLNKNANYALLRNYDDLPEINNSRDIDIVISRNDFKTIKKQLVKIFLSFEYKITTYYKSDRMYTFVLVNTDFEFLQFDFFFKTSLHGILLLKSKDLLNKREFNGKLYHVSKEYEFLDKYIYLKVLNVPYPPKYKHIRESVLNDSIGFDELVYELFGVESFSELEQLSGKKIITKLLFKNFRANISSIIQNVFYELSNIFNSQGISMSFTGPDGVGKTTVINEIIEIIGSHSEVQLFHHRPTIIGNISNVAKNIGVLEKVNDNYSEPHRGEKKGILNSFLRLCYYSTDYIIGYWLKIKRPLFRRSFVIFDRYYTDIIADSHRSNIYLNPKFLYYWGKIFIPKMKYNFLFTADADIILARKQELDKKGINDINLKLDYLASKKDYYLVLNNEGPKEAIQKILTIIFEEQHKRNIKRIGY